jgi:hypothetical protein
MEVIKREILGKIVLTLFCILTVWWITLRILGLSTDSVHNQVFAAVYGLISLLGVGIGFSIFQKWGGMKSKMGKSILFFTLGLLFQEVGQIIYSSYIYFLKIEIPYPSIGDLFFYGTIPLYIIGIAHLAGVSGVQISLKSFKSKIQAITIPVFILLCSYFFFLQQYEFDWSTPLTIFLDFAVPLGQAVYISLAILTYTLSKGVLGGIMKGNILFILFALFMQYIADWTFLYQASQETWYAGGINDYMYLCAYFLMTIGLLKLKTVYNKLRAETKTI